jgi:hypothetical protein
MRNQMSVSKKVAYVLMALPGFALEGLLVTAIKLGLVSEAQKRHPSARQPPFQPLDEHSQHRG